LNTNYFSQSLPANQGVYMVKVATGKQMVTKKVILK